MPWTGKEFASKHNKALKGKAASKAELAYTAGIIDGEGYVILAQRAYVIKRYGPYRRAVVSIGVKHTKFILLKWLQDRFGGAIYDVKRRSLKHSQTWEWRVGTAQAYYLAKCIRPYALLKRDQLDLVIAIHKTVKRRGKVPIPTNVLQFREDAVVEMKRLNRRGPIDAKQITSTS